MDFYYYINEIVNVEIRNMEKSKKTEYHVEIWDHFSQLLIMANELKVIACNTENYKQ